MGTVRIRPIISHSHCISEASTKPWNLKMRECSLLTWTMDFKLETSPGLTTYWCADDVLENSKGSTMEMFMNGGPWSYAVSNLNHHRWHSSDFPSSGRKIRKASYWSSSLPLGRNPVLYCTCPDQPFPPSLRKDLWRSSQVDLRGILYNTTLLHHFPAVYLMVVCFKDDVMTGFIQVSATIFAGVVSYSFALGYAF